VLENHVTLPNLIAKLLESQKQPRNLKNALGLLLDLERNKKDVVPRLFIVLAQNASLLMENVNSLEKLSSRNVNGDADTSLSEQMERENNVARSSRIATMANALKQKRTADSLDHSIL
jgi:hypothetical protein